MYQAQTLWCVGLRHNTPYYVKMHLTRQGTAIKSINISDHAHKNVKSSLHKQLYLLIYFGIIKLEKKALFPKLKSGH